MGRMVVLVVFSLFVLLGLLFWGGFRRGEIIIKVFGVNFGIFGFCHVGVFNCRGTISSGYGIAFLVEYVAVATN